MKGYGQDMKKMGKGGMKGTSKKGGGKKGSGKKGSGDKMC